eukprot:TRINITY_DN33184_c0_g1_i1.p1 TRINITY_DN33184_c0_g1~~TRINITY_DN33184_c0_g1_i1.p1  ORF type:complete len:683 (-),score=233.36 TRINITY_DN33184_c0_g1_i1:18-2066(-)
MAFALLLSGLASALVAGNEVDSLAASTAVQLRAVQAELATAEASLREARLKSSKELLHTKTEELADVEGRIAELQKAEQKARADDAKLDEVLAETHKMLTSPLAAETAALGLPSRTPILVQIANAEASQSAEQSRFLAQELATAKRAAASARAENEHHQKLLQQATQELDEAVAQSQLAQSKVGLQSQIMKISKELRETAHADKVALHDALAESKQVQEADQKGKMLARHVTRELIHEKKAFTDLQAEIEDQKRSDDELKDKSKRVAALLQKTSQKLEDSQSSLSILKKRTSQAMIRQQGAAFLTGTSQSKLQKLRTLLRTEKASANNLRKRASVVTNQADNATMAIQKEGLHMAVKSAEQMLALREKRAKRKLAAAKKQVLLLQQHSERSLGELEARYAAEARVVKAKHLAAIKAATEKSSLELRTQQSRLRSKKERLAAELAHVREVASQKLTASAAQLSQIESNLSRVRQDEQQKLGMVEASIAKLEAKLQDQSNDMESKVFDARQHVLQQQQDAFKLQNSIAAAMKEKDEASLEQKEIIERIENARKHARQDEKQLEEKMAKLHRKLEKDLETEASKMRVQEQEWQMRTNEVKSSKAADEDRLIDKLKRKIKEAEGSEAKQAAVTRKSLAKLTAEVQQKSRELKKLRAALAAEEDLSKAVKKEFQMFRGARAAAAAAR